MLNELAPLKSGPDRVEAIAMQDKRPWSYRLGGTRKRWVIVLYLLGGCVFCAFTGFCDKTNNVEEISVIERQYAYSTSTSVHDA